MEKIILRTLLFILLVVLNLDASRLQNLNQEEQEFIKQNKKIVLGSDEGWKPYIIKNEDGTISGYDSEVIGLINDLTGLHITLTTGSWKDMQQKAKDKKIDGLSTGTASQKRSDYLNYTNSYISMYKMVITSNASGKYMKSLDDLDGKKIVIHEGNAVDEELAKRFNKSTIIKVKTVKEVLQYVATNKADAMFGNGATLYLANQLGLLNLHLSLSLNERMDLVFGIRKDYPEVISIINKALNHIGKQKLLEIKKRWFILNTIENKNVILNKKEQSYLQNKKQINMCVDPNWLPFESIHNGEYQGIAAEYIALIKKDFPIPIKLVITKNWNETLEFSKNRKCDIIPLAMETENRKKYLNFTKTYLKEPLVIATKLDKSFIIDFQELNRKKIGVLKKDAISALLGKRYPNIHIISVKSVEDGLERVKDGRLFGYIDTFESVRYYFKRKFTGELKIAGRFDESLSMGIAIRSDDPVLLNIFEKYLANITPEQRIFIKNKWISVEYEKGIDKNLIYQIIFICFIIVLFFIYSNVKLNKKIKKATKSLNDKNQKLEESLENFSTILDTTLEMIVFYSIESRTIININQSGVKMFGFTRKEEVIGKHIEEFILESELPKVEKSIKQEIAKPYELILLKKDGSLLYTINSAKNITIDNKVIRMTTVIDLTEIKKQEKVLQQQNRLAQMGEMISMIAHQWRQPLGAISSAVFGIQTKISKGNDENILDYINEKHKNINEYVQFLSATIDDFRNFFKPDKAKEFVDINIPIKRALQIVNTSMSNKGITINTKFNIDDKINMYQTELMQVLLNILKNSEDNFYEKQILHPTIHINTQEKNGKYTIEISDNGGGIDEEILLKIFDPYFSTKNEKNGTGLGLYMSKMIVEDHHSGKLEVKNTQHGVCFTLVFIKKEEE